MISSEIVREYEYLFGLIEPLTGKSFMLELPTLDTEMMQLFMDQFAKEDEQSLHVILVDNASSHTTEKLKVGENIIFIFLPASAPELNPIEHVWDELREKYFHNRVFNSLDALELHLMTALQALEADPNRLCSIVAWPWIMEAIINSFMN